MAQNKEKNTRNDVVYDCTLGKHPIVLVSGEIIIDCVVETKEAADEPRVDTYV